MRPRKSQKSSSFTVRLTAAEQQQFQQLRERIDLRSNSDTVSYLLATVKSQRDDQQEMMYTLVDRLADHIERRFQSLNTIVQLNLALNDAFMKYVVSALPHIPEELKDIARLRGMDVYQNLNIAAVKEFQRRRREESYTPEKLGIETDEGTPA
jgi:predicted adenine nucleotide alpha hydrolase (AANH) superfamily ATPase